MTLATLDAAIAQVAAIEDRHARNESLAEEADRLARDFRAFTYAAWPHLGYQPLKPNTMHVDAICDHVQAAYERLILNLLVTIQPGAFKSTILSVLAPAWRWTHAPEERFVTASHHDRIATRDTAASRRLMRTRWYAERWSIPWTVGEDLKTEYNNDLGGKRVITHVGGGTGDRGTIQQIDDPHNAKEARYADTQLSEAPRWWTDTWVSRLDDTIDNPGVSIVLGQRIHQKDLIGFLLSASGRWTHLCLPTRYVTKHRYRYPKYVQVEGRKLRGDTRTKDGELLMPQYQDEEQLARRVSEDGVTAHTFGAQYQQDPAAHEGKLLKRQGWRYYHPGLSFYAGYADPNFTPERVALITKDGDPDYGRLPTFSRIVCSWDTSLKDATTSDYAVGSAWGVSADRPADRWLLRIWRDQAGLNEIIGGMLLLHGWADTHWPRVPIFSVIEKATNGPSAIQAIRSVLQGVIAYPEKGEALGSKELRAAAASPALDGGNCYLPGFANETMTDYAPGTPTDVQAFVEELSEFNEGDYDDQVDSWSQMVNFTRTPYTGKGRVRTAKVTQAPRPAGLPA